jgi:hypothetical protein
MTYPCKAGLPVLLCPVVSGSKPSLAGSVSTLSGANLPGSTVTSRASLAQACASCTLLPAGTATVSHSRLAYLFQTRPRNR